MDGNFCPFSEKLRLLFIIRTLNANILMIILTNANFTLSWCTLVFAEKKVIGSKMNFTVHILYGIMSGVQL